MGVCMTATTSAAISSSKYDIHLDEQHEKHSNNETNISFAYPYKLPFESMSTQMGSTNSMVTINSSNSKVIKPKCPILNKLINKRVSFMKITRQSV
jgi:hypothetical protein